MSFEPTSAFTFDDLVRRVAVKLGVAYYGPTGEEEAQAPVDTHDLAEVRRLVNDGIRMFIADGPAPNGWRWTRPLSELVLWAPVIESPSTNTLTFVSFDSVSNTSLVEADLETFFESMEEHTIDVDSGSSQWVISDYVSPTQVRVRGDATAITGLPFSIPSDGTYTLPRTFSGQFIGDLTYAENTNRGITPRWISEFQIRQIRQNVTIETGTPNLFAVRMMRNGTPRRRWEVVVHPIADENFTVIFTFQIGFDKLIDPFEVPPSPHAMDDAVLAACMATAERRVSEAPGESEQYYRQIALPAAYRIDASSAPKRLGQFVTGSPPEGDALHIWRTQFFQRPDITFE